MRHIQLTAALVLASVALLTGCASSPGHSESAPGKGESNEQRSSVSRAHLYSSLGELSAASSAVVIGSVDAQSTVKDIDARTEFTLATFHISTVLKADKQTVPGGTIIVRQTGGPKSNPPTPLFGTGKEYLLYLTPSGLPGPLDTQYYVTGANAGVYQAGFGGLPTGSFRQPDHEKGEAIPTTVTQDTVTSNLR